MGCLCLKYFQGLFEIGSLEETHDFLHGGRVSTQVISTLPVSNPFLEGKYSAKPLS